MDPPSALDNVPISATTMEMEDNCLQPSGDTTKLSDSHIDSSLQVLNIGDSGSKTNIESEMDPGPKDEPALDKESESVTPSQPKLEIQAELEPQPIIESELKAQPMLQPEPVPQQSGREAQSEAEPEPGLEPSKSVSQPNESPIEESSAHPQIHEKQSPSVAQNKEVQEKKKKDDDKLVIYKALAIKLKKELVKSREELHKLQEDSSKECNSLRQQVVSLEETLNAERQTTVTNTLTLEAKVKSLKQQLSDSEIDLQVLQKDYESYKVRASRIMQQNNPPQFDRTFVDERYKQLKELNDEQVKHIASLESQLSKSLEKNKELADEASQFQEKLKSIQEEVKQIASLDNKCETLSRENENLKVALKQFRTKLKEPGADELPRILDLSKNANNEIDTNQAITATNISPTLDDRLEDAATRLSPSASIKDGSQTNSSSSIDGYVHLKPAAFEIVSRSSVLEDAQNQIDNLTKAYLDSESTNSLLSEQVRALKEEIRRMQRVSERMELAENLEYLKNVVFKFLSLDSNHTEQKQRLIPVLGTVLKLSPDEVSKLHSLTNSDKTSMASSFFKL